MAGRQFSYTILRFVEIGWKVFLIETLLTHFNGMFIAVRVEMTAESLIQTPFCGSSSKYVQEVMKLVYHKEEHT